MSAAAGTLLHKWQLLQAVLSDPTLSPAAKIVAARLLHHHNTLTGQCSPSYDTLAHAVGTARSTVIKAVADLQASGWISIERVKVPGRTGAQSHVSNRYAFAFDRVTEDQGGSPKSGPPPSEIRTRGSLKPGPEHEKLKQGKRKKTLSVIEPSAFDRWWEAYPKKVGKDAARPAYERVVKTGRASVEELLAGAERYAVERTDEDRTYTKHPKTWLTGGHWADEPATRGGSQRRPRTEKSGITDLLRELEGRDPHGRDHEDGGYAGRAVAGTDSRPGPHESGDGMGCSGPILDLEPIRTDRK